MSNQDFDAGTGGGDSGIGQGLPGSDVYTETTSRSWLQKIGDSLKAIVIGLIFVVASGALLFWNEGRTAKTAAALAEGAGLVVSIDAGKIDPVNDGKLVHVAADTSATRPASDPDFGLDAKGLKLSRKVEMYQWKEDKTSETRKKVGGGEETITRYSYGKEWSDKGIDSGKFRNAAEHHNPSMPGVGSRSFSAPDAKVGAFALGDRIVQTLDAEDRFDAPDSALAQARARLGARARVAQGGVYAGADPDQPAVGDVRVTWRWLPLTPVSVVARQTQSTFAPWTAKNGNEVLLAETGVKEAAVLFKHGQDENRLIAWILRLVGALFMFLGFRMMLSLLEALTDVIPFLGDIVGAGASLVAFLCTVVVATLVVAIAWVFYRPLIAVAALVAGGALVWGLRRMARARVAALAPAPAPAPAAAGGFLAGAPLARGGLPPRRG